MLQSGDVLKDKYKIIEVAGRGGQGTVYRAVDQKKGYFERNEVAIKEMRRGSDFKSDYVNVEFIQQEVMILSRLKHPYLPRIFDVFTSHGNIYIVEEFLEGKTLGDILKMGNRMKPKKAVELAMRVADILDYLHRQDPQIIYRDLKPDNLIMQPGRLYLIDFSGCYIPGMGLGEGVAIRTRGYAPPEAYTSTKADPAFDVFSLGMLLYRMVTGFEVLQLSGPAPPLDSKKDNIPEPLVRVINKAIRKNKMMRYNSIWEMRLELEYVEEQLKNAVEVEAPEGETPPPPKIPIKYTLQHIFRTVALPVLDMLIFILLPLLLFRGEFSKILPFAKTAAGMPWQFYLTAFFILFIHISYRHWLDWFDLFSPINRFLHFPVRNAFDIRPIKWLVVIEVLLVIYMYYKLLTY